MARKYKRSANGRFAGGSGQSNGKAPAGQRRVIPKNGSKGVAQNKPKGRSKNRLKAGAKAVGSFAKKNPRLVGGVAALAVHAGVSASAGALDRRDARRDSKIYGAAKRYAESTIASKRGIGGKPGAGLKAAKRSPRGAYKIRSR